MNFKWSFQIIFGDWILSLKYSRIFLVFLILVFNLYLTLYCVAFINLSSIIEASEFGVLIWCSSPPGCLFPWPSPSGPEGMITESTNLLDYILYIYFLNTGLLFIILGCLWLINIVILYKWFIQKKWLTELINTIY